MVKPKQKKNFFTGRLYLLFFISFLIHFVLFCVLFSVVIVAIHIFDTILYFIIFLFRSGSAHFHDFLFLCERTYQSQMVYLSLNRFSVYIYYKMCMCVYIHCLNTNYFVIAAFRSHVSPSVSRRVCVCVCMQEFALCHQAILLLMFNQSQNKTFSTVERCARVWGGG